MLVKILLLSSLAFGVSYPLFICLSAAHPIQHFFHRFHMGCPAIIAGLAIVLFHFYPVDDAYFKWSLVIWLCCFMAVTWMSWYAQRPSFIAIMFLSAGGLLLYMHMHLGLLGGGYPSVMAALWSAMIVSAAFYAMNLGHFYLNVKELSIMHLTMATRALSVVLALRCCWDAVYFLSIKVRPWGDDMSLWSFSLSMDGFLLWVAILFGTILPLGATYFAFGTLQLKNTQATTGILYVLLASILLGDLVYKFYWIRYGIFM